MIEVKKLTKAFGSKKVLNGLNFQANEGEFVALLGPNGAGKSTFIRILSSLLNPSSGDIKIAGYRLPQQAPLIRSRLGVVTHQPLLYGDLTAEENLSFFSRLYGIPDERNRINDVLEQVGLSARKKDLIRTYSRGMQQRLAIGRAILHNPEVLLFDEPHTGLDQDACDMLDKILSTVASQGRTVVMTSHDLSRIEMLADRFDVLTRGRITSVTYKTSMKGNLLDIYREALKN
jgi:heme exporter protein A